MKKTILFSLLLPAAFLLALSCGKNSKNPTGPDAGEILPVTFVSVPGGTFRMGGEAGSPDNASQPAHDVTVSAFEMSGYEVTNAQYAAYLNEALASGDIEANYGNVYGKTGQWPGYRYLELGRQSETENRCWITFSDGKFGVEKGKENWPVVLVTWYGSKAFALHYGFDLPTEAEWEYACRGGHRYDYGTADGKMSASQANYADSGIKHPAAVGRYTPNPFGICDMSGNVSEWCHDWYEAYSDENRENPSGPKAGGSRVVRGGAWNSYDTYCQSFIRNSLPPDTRDDTMGFRVVRRISPQSY